MLNGPSSIETGSADLLDQCALHSTNLRELSAHYLAESKANTANWKVAEFAKSLREQIHERIALLPVETLREISKAYLCPVSLVDSWIIKGTQARTTADLLPHTEAVTDRCIDIIGKQVFPEIPRWQHPYLIAHSLLRARAENIISSEVWNVDKDYRTRVLRAVDKKICGADSDEPLAAYFKESAKKVRDNNQVLNIEMASQSGKVSGQLCKEYKIGALGISAESRSIISRKTITEIESDPLREAARRAAISSSRLNKGELVTDGILEGMATETQEVRVALLYCAAKKVLPAASRLCIKMLGPGGSSLVDDVIQESVIKASKGYNPIMGEPESYLMSAVRNRIIDYARKEYNSALSLNMKDEDGEQLEEVLFPNLDKLNDPCEFASESEISNLIAESVHSLPEDLERMVNLVIHENLSIREAAARESITPPAARYRFKKACELLAGYLREAA